MTGHRRKFSPQFKGEAVQMARLPQWPARSELSGGTDEGEHGEGGGHGQRTAAAPMRPGLAMDGCAPAFRALAATGARPETR